MSEILLNRKPWLGSEQGKTVKSVTLTSESATPVTENGRSIIKSGTLINDTYLGYGLLVNDVDVTDGARVGSIMIRGLYINANLPVALTTEQKAALAANGLVAMKVEADLNLKVAAVPGTTTVLGKLVSALQSDVVIDGDTIDGTLKYVTGYTEFSSNVTEQSGNYLALIATAKTGATITAKVIGSERPAVTLDDGIIVIRMRDVSKGVQFVATIDDEVMTVQYSFDGLTLTPAQ